MEVCPSRIPVWLSESRVDKALVREVERSLIMDALSMHGECQAYASRVDAFRCSARVMDIGNIYNHF